MVSLSIRGMTGWVNPFFLARRRPGTLSVARRRSAGAFFVWGGSAGACPSVVYNSGVGSPVSHGAGLGKMAKETRLHALCAHVRGGAARCGADALPSSC